MTHQEDVFFKSNPLLSLKQQNKHCFAQFLLSNSYAVSL